MFSLVVGLQDAASLYVGNLLGVRFLGFLVLFRVTVRSVIRKDASTESGLLPKQMHGSFYTKQGGWGQGESTIPVYRLRQGILSVFVTGNLRSHF